MNTHLPSAPDKSLVRIVMIGDVVGKPGLKITCESVPWLRQRLHAHVVIANAENAADGAGLRVREFRRLRDAGIDAVTLGDHIYRKRLFDTCKAFGDSLQFFHPLDIAFQGFTPGTGTRSATGVGRRDKVPHKVPVTRTQE